MSFDRLAKHYSSLEWLLAGRKLQKCRTAFLRDAPRAKSILLVGEGHGKFLAEICGANPRARICYVDASAGMARVAKARLESLRLSHQVQFNVVPILEFEPTETFDLVVTQFFLDCFQGEELAQVIKKLAGLLAPSGEWIIADFQVPSGGWRRVRSRLVLALAYSFFRMATSLPARYLDAPQPYLRANGLRLEKRAEFNFGLLYAELWQKAVLPPGRGGIRRDP